MLDTDQLRSFLAIVDSGSFTKAAERVHKTQSAVSMHIRRLEEQLGCALFVKQGRGARLQIVADDVVVEHPADGVALLFDPLDHVGRAKQTLLFSRYRGENHGRT